MSPSANTTKNALYRSASALLSGILLFCSFPPLEWSFCAWLALIPLIYLCLETSPGKAFRYGLISGLTFWLISIVWLTHVSYIGWFSIGFYCALYLAVFAMVVSWWFRRLETFNIQLSTSNLERMDLRSKLKVQRWMLEVSRVYRPGFILLFGLPAIWTGLEYARAHLLTGFAWNMLGVSQYACLNLIQCAEWGGAYLVSYLVVMGNTAIALVFISMQRSFETLNIQRSTSNFERMDLGSMLKVQCWTLKVSALLFNLLRQDRRHGLWPVVIAPAVFLLILTLALCYGSLRQVVFLGKTETIKIAALQLNVPQQYKWSEEWAEDIYRRLSESTAAAAGSGPDLIVWPETALPDCIRQDERSRRLVKETMERKIPLLAGSMDYGLAPEGTNFYNSVFLYLPGQRYPQVYNKRHLVAFGEFIPFARYFPFLRSITGIEEDFTPGKEVVVFTLADPRRAFSVLICFEDTLPYLARDCVRAGARLLVNQTNDAWFDPSWASRQQMIQCVFRCIENRVGCLRVTNTGVTCLIDRRGMIRSELAPLGREPRPPEVMRAETAFALAEMPLTFYTRRGDLFAIACAAFSLPLFIGTLLGFLRKRQ